MDGLYRRSRFAWDTFEWTTDVSAKPWIPVDNTIGGSRTSAAGIPASYIVRRDAMVELTLRVNEDEWPTFLSLMAFGQSSQTFLWYPDADESDVTICYLEAPIAGERVAPSRNADFLRVYEITITLRQAPASLFNVVRPYFDDAAPAAAVASPAGAPFTGSTPESGSSGPPPSPTLPPGEQALVLFEDDFGSGLKAGTQNGCRWAGVNGPVPPTVVADANNPSGFSLRFRFVGSESFGFDAFCEQNFELDAAGFEQLFFYLEWDVPANYFHRNDPNGPDNNKGLRVWGGNLPGDSRDVSYQNSSIKAGYSTLPYAQGHANYGKSQIITEFGNLDAVGTGNWGTGPWTRWFEAGTVERHAMFVRRGTTNGTSTQPGLGGDGQLRLWRNGTKVYDRSDLDIFTAGGWNRFRYGYVLGWSNSGFTETTDLLLRRIVIATDVIPSLIV